MKKISADFNKGLVKLKVENSDDLWHLSQIIEKGDLVSGKTLRKIKIGNEEKAESVRKAVFIKIQVEKIEFTENNLRVLGKIIEAPEDVAKGEHHTFNVEQGTEISFFKEHWFKYQINRLNESFEEKTANILIIAFDREEAFFALMKRKGYEFLTHIKGSVPKKGFEEKHSSNFYKEIISKIKEYDSRFNAEYIILGSPAFWKDELLKNLEDDFLRKRLVLATCSAIGKTAIDELLKRDEVKKVLTADRTTKEINLVETLMAEISKNSKAVYGIEDSENASKLGAVDILLVTDTLIQKTRQDNTFERLEKIMKDVDSAKGEVHIISSSHQGGEKLNGLGGIGAILRYRLNY